MAISSGTRIGRYEVLTKLGVGGMGVVYKAHDATLGRPVALKLLPPELVENQDLVRRFMQEARAASALNHPHIITIYEIGEAELDKRAMDSGAQPAGGDSSNASSETPFGAMKVHYIAMEFVNGETLRVQLDRGKTDLKRLLELLVQVADGLAKAHASGIVHRDLKPENIMITEDGYAKVLDFGLAKLLEAGKPVSSADVLEADTMMMSGTLPGMVMGTVGYMSPEQVQGKAVDQRSDIFSFGCILYEATTGRKPFDGDSMIDSMHRIVYAQATPIRELNPDTPAELQRIIRKCLSKSPDERYQSLRDIILDLRELLREYDSLPPVSTIYSPGAGLDRSFPSSAPPSFPSNPPSGTSGSSPTIIPTSRVRLRVLIGASVLVMAALTFVLFKVVIHNGSKTTAPMPFQTMRVTRLTANGKSNGAAISPDGKYVAHVVNDADKQSLWVRQVATSSNIQIVPPAEVVYGGLTFSRDGNYIYYVSADKSKQVGTLYQVPSLGGTPPKKLIEDVDSPVNFSPDGARFVFVRDSLIQADSRLIIANADGTGEQMLAMRKRPARYSMPAWSPDGKLIACSADDASQMTVITVSVTDGKEQTFTTEKWPYVGRIDWFGDGSGLVLNARAPTSELRQIWYLSYPRGEARRITNDLNDYASLTLTGDAKSLVVTQVDALTNLWIAPKGDMSRARQITSGAGKYNSVSWTPDGRIVYAAGGGNTSEIWSINADGSEPRQLTSDGGTSIQPVVSPDGRTMVFSSNRDSGGNALNLWRLNLDGSNPKQLTSSGKDFSGAFSSDGKWVIYASFAQSGKPTLWKVSIDGGEPVQLTDKLTVQPAVSPDGKQIACVYWDEQLSSPIGIGVMPFDGSAPIKVVNVPAGEVHWTADSSALCYINNRGGVSNIFMQPLAGGLPKPLTDFKSDMIFHFDWSRDGKQLALSRGIATADVVLISNIQ